MNYRIRNTRTEETLTSADEADADPATLEGVQSEWVLEFEIADDEWRSSGFHTKDILGVKDPRPLVEMLDVLRQITKEKAA